MSARRVEREAVTGVHRLSSGVSNFYVIVEDGRLLLVDAGASRDWDLFVRCVAGSAAQGRNEGRYRTYVFRAEFWRTVFGLMRHGGVKIVPIHRVSAFADGHAFDLPGRPRAIHVPGHTPGMSALLLERRRILLTGDCLVTRNPLTGRIGPQVMPRALNRDTATALASLAKLETVPADIVLPGHGDPWLEGARAGGAL